MISDFGLGVIKNSFLDFDSGCVSRVFDLFNLALVFTHWSFSIWLCDQVCLCLASDLHELNGFLCSAF